MGSGREKKLRLFNTGASALKSYLGSTDYYVCPLCMYGFSEAAIRTGMLTLEHVPPKSVGGTGILLTCKECNSTSGGRLEGAVHRRDQQRRFKEMVLGKDPNYRGQAKWIVNGETLRANVYREGKFLTVAGIPKLNDPAAVDRMMNNPSINGRLTSSIRYHRRYALISDLRSAYLAAFALLGYRYALHPAFTPIREQIAKPDMKIVDGWSLHLDPQTPLTRGIFAVSKPCPCLAVQLDRVAVLLPIPGRSDDLYQQLRPYVSERRLDVTGKYLGWPESMRLKEDFSVNSQLPPLTLRIVDTS